MKIVNMQKVMQKWEAEVSHSPGEIQLVIQMFESHQN